MGELGVWEFGFVNGLLKHQRIRFADADRGDWSKAERERHRNFIEIAKEIFREAEYFSEKVEEKRAAGIAEADEGDGEIPKREKHPRVRKRQKKVKKLWVEGLTDREIAEALLCGESTVKRDREALGLKTRK